MRCNQNKPLERNAQSASEPLDLCLFNKNLHITQAKTNQSNHNQKRRKKTFLSMQKVVVYGNEKDTNQ